MKLTSDTPLGLGRAILTRLGGGVALLALSVFLVHANASLPNPRPDSRMVYSSSSAGNDANDGLSAATPKKTIAAAVALLREGFPDWLLLRRGDEWNEGLGGLVMGGRSEVEPVVVTGYGPGNIPPRLNPTDPDSAWPSGSNVVVHGVTMPPRPSDGLVMVPGGGWSGPTLQPGPTGSPGQAGYDAKAIARWDVVPFQTFDGSFSVGVVAFHINGIDRVEFAVNGGPWVTAYEMSMNPQSGVWEYWANLDASLFSQDGPAEVRAIVWPSVGLPRVLEPLVLFSNGGGSLRSAEVFVSPNGDDINHDGSRDRPYKSIFRAGMALQTQHGGRADGGIISLLPGDHIWGTAGRNSEGQYIGNLVTVDRWLEIRSAPGVDPSSVRITATGAGGLKTTRVRINGVTLLVSPINAVPTNTQPTLWISECTMIGPNRTTDIRWTPGTGYTGGMFVTESRITGGRYGVLGATMVRNVIVEGIGDDAFTNNLMVVNADVRDQWIPPGSGFHSDVVQLHASATPLENIIVYNLKALDCGSQPWHIGYTGHVPGPDWKNLAFVNVFIENELAGATAQWCVSADHVLWWHMGVVGAPLILRDSPPSGGNPSPPTTIRNFSMRNSILERFNMSSTGSTPRATDPSWAENNHFRDITTSGASAVGANATVGGTLDELFMSPANNDYRPALGFLRNRLDEIITPVDATSRPVVSAIGPLQP